jgi:Na+-driven multidrug efflux pump
MLGVGKTKRPFVYNIIGMWGIRIVGTYICTQILHMGLASAWGCMIAHNLLLFVCFLTTFLRKSWNPMEKDI